MAAINNKPRQLTMLQALMVTALCALGFLVALQRQQISSERARHAESERRLTTFAPSLPHIQIEPWGIRSRSGLDHEVSISGNVFLPDDDIFSSPMSMKATLLDQSTKELSSEKQVITDAMHNGYRAGTFSLQLSTQLKLPAGLYVVSIELLDSKGTRIREELKVVKLDPLNSSTGAILLRDLQALQRPVPATHTGTAD